MFIDLLFGFFLDFSLIALPVSLAIRKERNLKKALQLLGFRPMHLKEALKKSLFLFLAMLAVSIWFSIALRFLNLDDLYPVSQAIEEAKSIYPLFFWIVAVRVVSEEVFFRGLLANKWGILPSSLLFAFFHFGYGSAAEVLGAFVLGLLLAKAFQLNKNLYPNILAHIGHNAIAMFAN